MVQLDALVMGMGMVTNPLLAYILYLDMICGYIGTLQ